MERPCLIKSHINNAQLRYRRNKRRIEFLTNLAHLGQGRNQDLGQVVLVKIARFEDKLTDTVTHYAGMLDTSVSDVLISRQQYPRIPTHKGKPFVVRRAAAEMR